MKVKFLGAHNAEAGSVKLPGVLVDSTLALDAGSLSSLSVTAQLNLRAIILTHQHYDHLRDLPVIGMNLFLSNASVAVYGLTEVRSILAEHLLSGSLYPQFLDRGTLDYRSVLPGEPFQIGEHHILPLLMEHSVPTMGFEVSSGNRRLFYSGDTGPNLSNVWMHTQPDLIVIEVTASNRWTDFGREAGHLTPALLREELANFKKLKGYVPPVFTVHMNPFQEDDIRTELAEAARTLNSPITPAHEGLEIEI